MDYKPRNQAVFFPIPQTVAEGPMLEDRPFLYKWNALQATGGTPIVYEGLGFECMAAGIEAGKSLTFDFGACNVDSVEVELRMLPSHPVNGSGLRIQVTLGGQVSDAVSYHAKPRSEEWKQNILSGQAVRRFTFPVDASSGAHCLTVTALDEGAILDQIYIYKK